VDAAGVSPFLVFGTGKIFTV